LYAYKERFWGEEGFRKVCEITRHLVNELLKVKDKIVEVIASGRIELTNLLYPNFNNTIEIIP
jgi:hypothetical protein